jgi:hypothetical protein
LYEKRIHAEIDQIADGADGAELRELLPVVPGP